MSTDLAPAEGDATDLAAALGDAITELPEYERLEEAERAVKASDDAQERIEQFEARREEFMRDRQRGEATREDGKELEQLRRDLYDLPVMQSYQDAQEDLADRLASMNETISAPLDVDFADLAGTCCKD